MTNSKPISTEHLGQDFDEFLAEEGIAAEVEARAIKKLVVALLGNMGLSQVELAERLDTSRTQVRRLLDPDYTTITLSTLQRAAGVAGHRLVIGFEPAQAVAETTHNRASKTTRSRITSQAANQIAYGVPVLEPLQSARKLSDSTTQIGNGGSLC